MAAKLRRALAKAVALPAGAFLSALLQGGDTLVDVQLGSARERSPNQEVIETVARYRRADGQERLVTNTVTVLETGMFYDPGDGSGKLLPSREEIEPAGNHYVARHGPHKVIWPADIAAEPLDILTSDQKRFRCQILGLSAWDVSSGRRVWLAQLQSAKAELIEPRKVLYRGCFSNGISADVVFDYRKASLSQDVILRSTAGLPDAAELTASGLDPATSFLEVATEFLEMPEVTNHVPATPLPGAGTDAPPPQGSNAPPVSVNAVLDFGVYRLTTGGALSLGDEPQSLTNAVPPLNMDRQLQIIYGRKILFERIRWTDLQPLLAKLPRQASAATPGGDGQATAAAPAPGTPGSSEYQSDHHAATLSREIPAHPYLADERRASAARPRFEGARLVIPNTLLAQATPAPRSSGRESAHSSQPGVLLDWTLLASVWETTLKGDETYLVNGQVNIQYLTIEGGTVVKLTNGSPANINVSQGVYCLTDAYRPATFCSVWDNSVGQSIITGQEPPPMTGSAALIIGSHWSTLENLRFRRTWIGICYNGVAAEGKHVLRNAQFVDCVIALEPWGYSSDYPVNLYAGNVLVSGGSYAIYGVHFNGTVEHLTADNVGALDLGGGWNDPLTVRNSVLVNVPSVSGYGIALSGSYNGFYSSQQFGDHIIVLAANPFAPAVGAGAHYLSPTSGLINQGTSAIDSTTAWQLKSKTVFPPSVRTDPFHSDTTLGPTAPRDNDSAPDLGYHYDPLDWCWSGLSIDHAALLLTNGVAVGVYGTQGLTLLDDGKVTSEGSPTNLNVLARYHTAQEPGPAWGGTAATMSLLNIANSPAGSPEVRLRFTKIPLLADTAARRLVFDNASTYTVATLAAADCQVKGGVLNVSMYPGDLRVMPVALTNNLFERVDFTLEEDAGYARLLVTLRNNLFRSGRLSAQDYDGTGTWSIKDNLFDNVNLFANVPNSNNGYTASAPLPGSGGGDQVNVLPDYITGPLGNYYYPTTGGNLSRLLNAGSRPAGQAGLYHYTVRQDQTKAAGNTVSIGCHYPAVQNYSSSQASLGWATGQQPANGWSYQSFSLLGLPPGTAMVWDASRSLWAYTTDPNDWVNYYCEITAAWQHDGGSRDSVRVFQAPYTGTVRIDTVAWDGSPNGTADGKRIRILKGSTEVAPWTRILVGTAQSDPVPINVGALPVTAGDYLYFQENMIGNTTCDIVMWDPRISYLDTWKVWDTDNDGLPDYFEDRNGDGQYNTGDLSNWQNPNTAGNGLSDLQNYQLSVNVLVNDPAQDYGNEQNTQFESACAVLDGKVIVAYVDSNNGIYGLGATQYPLNRTPRFVGYAVSAVDGGATFRDGGNPPVVPNVGDAGDPVLAVDRASKVVYLVGTSARSTAGNNGLPLWKSADGGTTFGNPAIVRNDLNGTDKPWIAVDNAAGVGQHDVYLTCQTLPYPKRLWLTVSTDGNGTTWGTPMLVRSVGSDNVSVVACAVIVLGSDHTGSIVWFEQSSAGINYLKMRSVQNRGATLGDVHQVVQLVTTDPTDGNLHLRRSNSAAVGDDFRAFPFPVPAASPTRAGHLYVAYADKAQNADPYDRADVFFLRSTDGGVTWDGGALGIPSARRLSTVADNDQWMPVLVARPDGAKLFAAWFDRRNDPANSMMDVYGCWGTVAGDGTVTFGTDFRITTANFPPVFAGTLAENTAQGHYDPCYPPEGVNLNWWYGADWPPPDQFGEPTTFGTYRDHVGEYNGAWADTQYVYTSWTDSRSLAAGTLFAKYQRDVRMVRITWPQ